MALRIAIAAAGAALVLAGCGASAKDQVRAKVQQFAAASAAHDYTQICDGILSISLLERVARSGISCQEAMQVALGNVRNPRLSIGRVKISGDHAAVITLSLAQGQNASLAEIDLVREQGGWRISALGGGAGGGALGGS